jgi:hypothetical protein
VPEKHDAFIRELFTDVFMDDMRVVYDKMPAIPGSEKYRLWLRTPVPAVIVGADDNPTLVRLACKAIIAIDVFAHAVEELDDAGDISFRAPNPKPDFVISLSEQ